MLTDRSRLHHPRAGHHGLGAARAELRDPLHPQRTTEIGGLVLSDVSLSIIVGTLILCAVLYLFFSRTRLGIAMQAASQNQLAAY